MISFISFIIVIVGSFNWLSIGMLQYDFVAGLFGSQANLFSRVIYVIVGLASIWLIYTTIRQKGKIFVSPKNSKDAKLVDEIKSFVTKDKDKNKNEDDSDEQNKDTIKNKNSENKENK